MSKVATSEQVSFPEFTPESLRPLSGLCLAGARRGESRGRSIRVKFTGPFRPLYQCAAQEHECNHDPRLPITKACLDRAPSQRRPRYSDEKKRPRASDRLACSEPLRVCARPGTLERHGVPGEDHCGGQPECSSQQWSFGSPGGDSGGCSKRGLRRPAPNGSSAGDRDGSSRAQFWQGGPQLLPGTNQLLQPHRVLRRPCCCEVLLLRRECEHRRRHTPEALAVRERLAKPGPLDDGAVDGGDEDGADDGAHAHLEMKDWLTLRSKKGVGLQRRKLRK